VRTAPPLQPRLIADEWREPIARYLEGRRQVTVTEVIEAAHADPASTAAQRRATDIMRDLHRTPQRDKRGRRWQRGTSGDSNGVTDDSTDDSNGVTATRSAVTDGVTTATDDAHRVAARAIPSPIKRST
jgi:hypothetical protein